MPCLKTRLNESLHTQCGDPHSSPTWLKEYWQNANIRRETGKIFSVDSERCKRKTTEADKSSLRKWFNQVT